MNNVLNSN